MMHQGLFHSGPGCGGDPLLTLLILLSWIAAAAALSSAGRRTSSRRAAPALPGEVDQHFQAAQTQHDHPTLVRYYRLALERAATDLDRHLIRINLAYSLTALEQYEEALAELDKVSPKQLSAPKIALWLNNRAYVLLHLHRLEEALDNLQDAQELTSGDDLDPTLAACISGTRGMVLFKQGNLDRAESALQLALRLESSAPVQQFGQIAHPLEGDPHRTAERWFWLSEIAMAKQDWKGRTERLQHAARYPFTLHGRRALALLGRPTPQTVL